MPDALPFRVPSSWASPLTLVTAATDVPLTGEALATAVFEWRTLNDHIQSNLGLLGRSRADVSPSDLCALLTYVHTHAIAPAPHNPLDSAIDTLGPVLANAFGAHRARYLSVARTTAADLCTSLRDRHAAIVTSVTQDTTTEATLETWKSEARAMAAAYARAIHTLMQGLLLHNLRQIPPLLSVVILAHAEPSPLLWRTLLQLAATKAGTEVVPIVLATMPSQTIAAAPSDFAAALLTRAADPMLRRFLVTEFVGYLTEPLESSRVTDEIAQDTGIEPTPAAPRDPDTTVCDEQSNPVPPAHSPSLRTPRR